MAVIGGSVAGLSAGLAMQTAGLDVDVFERAAGVVPDRGAGIAVQQELLDLVRRYGGDSGLPRVWCTRRRFLTCDSAVGIEREQSQSFTSWAAICRTLRRHLSSHLYHPGSAVAGFSRHDDAVELTFADDATLQADLLVCADGWRSTARHLLLPAVTPRYTGYVAWRGTLEEAVLPRDLVAFFDGFMTFSGARSGGHILCYLIPGPDDATLPGGRRLNWVWYVDVTEGEDLDRLLTDRSGRRQDLSLPPGAVPDGTIADLCLRAYRELHPRLAELVDATPDPFIQGIADLAVPHMAFGRVLLVGDAAFVVRPHTGAAASKAAGDATVLGDVVAGHRDDLDGALRHWETERLARGRQLVDLGVDLARHAVGPGTCPTSPEDAAARYGRIALAPG